MMQWADIPIQELYGFNVKAYRPTFIPASTVKINFDPNHGLDRYAKEHLGSELFNYKMLDTNFIKICECLGDIEAIKTIEVPIE